MREAPKKIYLQWYPREHYGEDCSWCSDKIDENDTEYIRADIEPKHETVEQTRQWLIDDIKSLEMQDVFKLYRYVRRYMVANIDGLIDPLANHHGKPEDK